MIDLTRETGGTDVRQDRRRSPRIQLLGEVRGQILPSRTTVDVREIGLGGFSVETRDPLRPGDVLSFVLTVEGGADMPLRARVVHCRPRTELDAAGLYVTGLEFVVDDAHDESEAVAALVDKLTSVLSFE